MPRRSWRWRCWGRAWAATRAAIRWIPHGKLHLGGRIDPIAWQTVTRIAESLHADPLGPDGLDDLAARAGYEPTHFAKLFREVMGDTPVHYLRALRLERAALALEQTALPSAQVAQHAGYGSAEAFSRAFRRRFGLSPSQFRRGTASEDGWGPQEPPDGLQLHRERWLDRGVGGWSLPTSAEPDVMSHAVGQMAAAGLPPFHVGVLAEPWGWTQVAPAPQFRAVRLTSERPIPPPFRPLEIPRRRWWVVPWEGPTVHASPAIFWLHEHGLPSRGLRSGFAPTITLLQRGVLTEDGPLEIWIPVWGGPDDAL